MPTQIGPSIYRLSVAPPPPSSVRAIRRFGARRPSAASTMSDSAATTWSEDSGPSVHRAKDWFKGLGRKLKAWARRMRNGRKMGADRSIQLSPETPPYAGTAAPSSAEPGAPRGILRKPARVDRKHRCGEP